MPLIAKYVIDTHLLPVDHQLEHGVSWLLIDLAHTHHRGGAVVVFHHVRRIELGEGLLSHSEGFRVLSRRLVLYHAQISLSFGAGRDPALFDIEKRGVFLR